MAMSDKLHFIQNILYRMYCNGGLDVNPTIVELKLMVFFLKEAGETIDINEGYHAPDSFVYQDTEYKQENELEQATRQRLLRVKNLISGFESNFGLRLLYQTYIEAKLLPVEARNAQNVTNAVLAKPFESLEFSQRQITIALARLNNEGWFT